MFCLKQSVSFINQDYQQELSDFHDWHSTIPQESKGYEFESETDTETIAKLVKYMYDNRESEDLSFATLVERVTQQLVGACSSTEQNCPETRPSDLSCDKHGFICSPRKELLSWSSRVSITQERL